MIDVHVDGIIYAEQPRGGISRMWTNILRRLPAHGCQVRLYLPRGVTGVPDLGGDVSIVEYPRRMKLRPARVFGGLAEALFATSNHRMWAKATKGVFHSTHFTTYDALDLPQVVTVHDLFHECLPDCFEARERDAFVPRRRRCIENATRIIVDSEATRQDVERIYGTTRSETIHLAVEPSFRRLHDCEAEASMRQRLAGNHKFILFVGTRYAYKNFNGLLAAYVAWPRREQFHLVAVGGGPSIIECAQLRAYGLTGKVHFHGALSDDDLVGAYNAASAVVVPSLSEGFGFPVWEAMACGTPVVAANAGSLPEIGGSIPVYFDHGPPGELVRALEEAVVLPRDSERVTNGIRLATRRSWDDVTKEYASVYRELAGVAEASQADNALPLIEAQGATASR